MNLIIIIIILILILINIIGDERVAQQLQSSPPLGRIPLQATGDKIPKLPRGRCRRLWRLRQTDGAHEAGPVPSPGHRERKPAQIKLQDAHPHAPDIPGVPIVLPVVQIRVNPFRTHVSNRPYGGVAGIHSLWEDSGHAEIGYFDLFPGVDEEVGGLDVAVDDAMAVEVVEAGEDLAREIGEAGFVVDWGSFEGATVHVL